MKLQKKLIVAALSLTMLSPVALTSVVNAQDAGSITIQDTQKGSSYSIYKIFDATVSGTAVSYTIPAGSSVASSPNFASIFDTTTNGGLTYAVRKEGVSDQQVTEWARSLKGTPYVIQVGQTVLEDGNDSNEVFAGIPYGYYLIDSTTASPSLAMISSVSPNGTVREKNTTPTWGEDTGGKTISNGTSFNIGDKIDYTIVYENAMNYNKDKKVYQYVLEDTMPEHAVRLDENSIVVQVGNKVLVPGSEYTFTRSNLGFQITIPWAATQTAQSNSRVDDDFYYSAPQKITVTYSGTVLEGAIEGVAPQNSNSAIIYPNDDKTGVTPKNVNFLSGEVVVNKVDANGQAPLSGAEFVLKDDSGNFLKVTEENGQITKNEFVSGQENATVFITSEQGKVTITGLKKGDYQLVEVKAPKGYNLLGQPVPVQLGAAGGTGADPMIATPTVENKQGVELPATGGMGTIIFYVLGSALIGGSIIAAVVKRRMNAE